MGWNAIMELRHACMIRIVPTLFNARSNPWDGTHNGTTTFMFDSPNTWNVICTAPRDWRIHARTMFESWSDRARVVEWCFSAVLRKSLCYFEVLFFVAGAEYGDAAGWIVLLCAIFSRFPQNSLIFWSVIFRGRRSWLMILDCDSRCSA